MCRQKMFVLAGQLKNLPCATLRKKQLMAATVLGALVMNEGAFAQPSSISSVAPKAVKAKTRTASGKTQPQQSVGQAEALDIHASRRNAPGGGMMRREHAARSVQSVTENYIAMQSPTSAPLDLISNLPSVNVSSSDPSGIDGSSISSRGLNDVDIGFLLNGMPIANGSSTSGASFIQNYIDSQNISVESMTPGSISVEDPLTSAAAGALAITTRKPSDKFGGQISGSYGSFNTSREFLRLESGLLGNSGIKGYASFSHTRADAWRGSGDSDRKHMDFRAQKTFGKNSSIDVFAGYTHYESYLNRYPTMKNFLNDKHGRPVSTPLSYVAQFNPLSPSSYYAERGTNKDQFYVSAPLKMALNPVFNISVVPYYQRSAITLNSASRMTEGATYAGSQLQTIDLNGDGKIKSSTKYDAATAANSVNQQGGVVAALHWGLKNNSGQVGYWHEENSYSLQTPVMRMNQTTGARPSNTDRSAYYRTSQGNVYYSANYLGSYSLNAGFLEDTQYFLNHKMSLTAGIKVTAMTLRGHDYLPGGMGNSSQTFVSPTPRMSWSHNFNSHHQVYVNAEGDFRAPSPVGLITRYSTSTGRITTSGASVKPQYSIKEEIGYRYSGNFLVADISAFNFNVANRLLTLNTYSNDVQVSQTMNAGGETIRGVDIMLSTRPLLKRFRPYVSFEYLHATMDNNLPATTSGVIDYLRTKGKQPVMTPKYMASAGLTYNEGPFFMNATLHFTAKQYSTFMNDQSMPYYFTNTISMGYHFPKFWIAQSPTFRLNFSNVTGQNKLGGVYSFSNNAKSTVGVYGNRIAADSAPTYAPLPSFSLIGTVSTSF